LDCLNTLIAEPAQLKVPLRREIDGDITQMEQLLTGMQLALMSILLSKKRVLVEGGAGTGKTILAMESAIRESQEGRKVLFCCKSPPLAKLVKDRLRIFTGIEVKNLEELLAMINLNADINQLISTAGWNAIYIDEAQDIDWESWDIFEEISQSNNISLKVFFDSNQSVYRIHDDLATRLRATSIPLSINLRNTKRIAKVTEGLYKGPLIHCAGPEGVNPITFECNFDESIERTIELIHVLMKQESITPQMISILVPSGAIREDILGILMKRRIPACDSIRSTGHEVIVESVARFKGLESEIVILLTDRILAKNQELSYVGVSRARSRLYVFGALNKTNLGKSLELIAP
jgi:DNA helicase IV